MTGSHQAGIGGYVPHREQRRGSGMKARAPASTMRGGRTVDSCRRRMLSSERSPAAPGGVRINDPKRFCF